MRFGVACLLTLLRVFGCGVGCWLHGWGCMLGSLTGTCAGCMGLVLGRWRRGVWDVGVDSICARLLVESKERDGPVSTND